MMKVSKLIELLSTMNPESEVIMQRDSEGNRYSPLYCVDHNAVYIPDSTYSGDVYDLSWSADDVMMTKKEWAKIQKSPRCVVLAPTN
jgi:hypothetical protein